jgi:DNA helicase HerA-like ATPase
MKIVGSVISGRHGSILIRQKSGAEVELGDLLLVKRNDASILLQVYDVVYGSQIPPKHLEMISGMKLEGYGGDLDFMDPALRNYVLVQVKAVAKIEDNLVRIPKTLPPFMSDVRHVTKEDFDFLTKPSNPVFLGSIRSGSKVMEVPVYLNALDVFTHHILVPATTGRGKSNLVKVMVWDVLDKDFSGMLVLDPHDEYYGRHGKGLKDHPLSKKNLMYYSPKPVRGSISLVFNLELIRPWHFEGIVKFTEAQEQALIVAFNTYKEKWLPQIARGAPLEKVDPRTISVLQRKMDALLGIYADEDGTVHSRTSVFSASMGQPTLKDILEGLEKGKKIILDTSLFTDEVELLIGSVILHELLYRYKNYKQEGTLDIKPVVSVVVEEAPRVLSSEVLTSMGDNIYSDIAREGRKFKVGLVAITQLASLIPKTVLANLNTKIILGNELVSERLAIINSASQDLSADDRNIASLDKGEAIITSNFTKFAVPVQTPLFEEHIKQFEKTVPKEKRRFV